MKNILTTVFLSLALFLVWSMEANAGFVVNRPVMLGLNNGLVGYWSFDGPQVVGTTAFDESGNGNNGTLFNDPTRAIGRIGQGMNFNNPLVNRQYVDIGSAVVSSYPLTMC